MGRARRQRRNVGAQKRDSHSSERVEDESSPSLFAKSVESARQMGRDIRDEVHSLLTTDLHGLPDVQQLIRDHFHSLETTTAHLVEEVCWRSKKVRSAILKAPEARQTLAKNFSHLMVEWREYLQPLLKQGMNPSDAILHCIDNFPELELPTTIAQQLAKLPNVRSFLLQQLNTVSEFSSDVYESLEENLHALPDMQRLVLSNFKRLPHLRDLHSKQYASPMPMLKEIHRSPRYMRDNEYILTGYRPELLSYRRCIESLFYLHNETGNIWTHLLGGIFFIFFAAYAGSYIVKHDQPWQDRMLFFVFWSTAVTCLFCSAVFHTMFCHSRHTSSHFSKLDYAGIIALISGSVYAVIYFTFYWQPFWQRFYIGLTSVFGILACYVTFSSVFEGHGKKGFRVLVFICLAATSVVPSIHYGQMCGFDNLGRVVDTFWLFKLSCPLYLVGALVFVKKVPECWFPGRFDYIFHSHQLWHIFVTSAAYCHYRCVQSMMDFRLETPNFDEMGCL